MALEIEIDRSVCQGEKECVKRAPRTFSLDRDGVSRAASQPGDDDTSIRNAANACPHFAIKVREASGN